MEKLIIAAFVAALTGCATSSSGVAPVGDGRYMLHGSDLTGWGAPNDFKAALLKVVCEYCAKQGKELTQVGHTGNEAGFFTTASADVTFRCK